MPRQDFYEQLGMLGNEHEQYSILLEGMNKLRRFATKEGLLTNPLFNDSLTVLSQVFIDLAPMSRWSVFHINPMEADTNIADHSLRQTQTTIEFSGIDLLKGRINPLERDILCSTAAIHDVGELEKGDIPLPEKANSPRDFDYAESVACFKTIATAIPNGERQQRLKEILVKVAMGGLTDKDREELLGTQSSSFSEEVDWGKLERIFHTYESIGYMKQRAIPGLDLLPNGYEIPSEFHDPLYEGDQAKFKAMIGLPPSEVPLEVRRAMLFSAVSRNTRRPLFDARIDGLPSAHTYARREDNQIRRADRRIQSNIRFSEIHRRHKRRISI